MSAELATAAQEVQRESPEISNALDFVKGFAILSAEDFDFAGSLVRDAKANWKRLEERRTEITKPLLAAKRGVDALFKPALDRLAEIEANLKAKIGEYTAAQEAARVAAMQRSAEQFAAGGTPTEAIPDRAETKGVSVRAQWDFEVTDPAQVPRDLCSPDAQKIAAAIWYADTERTPPRPIAGLRFFLRQRVTVRT